MNGFVSFPNNKVQILLKKLLLTETKAFTIYQWRSVALRSKSAQSFFQKIPELETFVTGYKIYIYSSCNKKCFNK